MHIGAVELHKSHRLQAGKGIVWRTLCSAYCKATVNSHPVKLRAACAKRGSDRCRQLIEAMLRGASAPAGGWPPAESIIALPEFTWLP